MRQRFILKVVMRDDRYKAKARKIIIGYHPNMAELVPLGGVDYEGFMFACEDLDIVDLCNLLRKKVGPTDIMSITPDGFMPPPNLPPPLGSDEPPSSASSSSSSAFQAPAPGSTPFLYGQPPAPAPFLYGQTNPYYPPPAHQETCSIM